MRLRYVLLNAYGKGGTVRTVFNQATAMAERGHRVEVVSVLRRRDELMFPLDARVRVTTLVDQHGGAPEASRGTVPLLRRLTGGAALGTRRTRPARQVPAGEFGAHYFTREVEDAVIRFLRGVPDGVLVTTRPALNVLSALHTPAGVVRVAQEHMNLGTHRPDVRAAIARHYPAFDAVAVLTPRDRDDYRALLPGTRVTHIPNAVHVAVRRPSTHTARVAVAAGRLVPQKGFDLLVPAFGRAVEAYPDWQLRIFGTGERKDELRELIDRHGLYNNVFLMGHSRQLEEELANASFYVLSSRFEGLPMVMIEAMGHALPVVSFDCPTGPAEILTDGSDGFLVPPGDVAALGDAMARMMADEALRAELGVAALRTSAAYRPEAVHPRWERLFEELTGTGAPEPAARHESEVRLT